MRRVKPAKSLDGARLLLLRRRVQKYLPRRAGRFFGRLALVLAAVVAMVGGVDAVDRGSRLQTAFLTVTAALGLAVHDVEVEGRSTTPAEDVLKAIDVARDMPILGVSPDRARQRLESLPWVRSASVERRLPDTIVVTLSERRPLALWQRNGKLALIDTDGVVVTTENLDRYGNLLLVVGDEAPQHAQDLVTVLAAQPELDRHVQSAVWVGGRRWNLQLDGGITVELPETGLAQAWAKLADIERSHALLAREVSQVDLRLADRVVVLAPAPEPAKSSGPAKPVKSGTKPT